MSCLPDNLTLKTARRAQSPTWFNIATELQYTERVAIPQRLFPPTQNHNSFASVVRLQHDQCGVSSRQPGQSLEQRPDHKVHRMMAVIEQNHRPTV